MRILYYPLIFAPFCNCLPFTLYISDHWSWVINQ